MEDEEIMDKEVDELVDMLKRPDSKDPDLFAKDRLLERNIMRFNLRRRGDKITKVETGLRYICNNN